MGSIPTYSRHKKRRSDVKKELMRRIPKIDEVLNHPAISKSGGEVPPGLFLKSAREITEEKRQRILRGDEVDEEDISIEAIAMQTVKRAKAYYAFSMREVINCTGVSLHTNLGRSPLSDEAGRQVIKAAFGYNTLEYDVERGERGSRHQHLEQLIKNITGAEAAIAVNNNAAATMLCLAALGRGRETIVSRGELVEIGGSFRIPEIMEESGCTLVEVGTTNKTRISDYRNKISDNTAILLKVHTSNYRITGFTEEASLEELVKLGKENGLPVVHDLGSGLMEDLSDYGISEPTVKASLRAGADVVLFSGDKLLGGPQAGIIIGKREYISRMKNHPLARAFRIDKLTISALEATFRAYYDRDRALRNIPILRMLTASEVELAEKAQGLADKLSSVSEKIKASVVITENQVGGGSAPGTFLKGAAVAVEIESISTPKLERLLRRLPLPVIGRISHDDLLLEVRTLLDGDVELIAEGIKSILNDKDQNDD